MKNAFWSFLLFISIFSELCLLSFGKNFLGSLWSPALWLVSGFATAVSGFFLFGFKKEETLEAIKKQANWERFLVLGIYLVGLVYFANWLSFIFVKYPIDPAASDIVPSIELYVKRFLSGQPVYTTLVFPNHTVNPTYFPLMWMPYVFSEILNIDYRWTPYGLFMLVLFFYYWHLAGSPIHWLEKVLKAGIPFFILSKCLQFGDSMFGYAVELVPVSFYLLLSSSLFSKNRWLTGAGILVCLLSRYAFTFWLPVYLLMILMTEGWKSVFRMSAVATIGVLVLYILPFLAKNPTILTKGLEYYDKTAEGQWQVQGWQAPGEKPYHLTHGLSFSGWFYDQIDGNFVQKLNVVKKIHISACLIAAGLIFLFFMLFKNRALDINAYALLALKFYLTVFYGFWYVPFPYLYLLPLFISIPILFKTKIFSTFVVN